MKKKKLVEIISYGKRFMISDIDDLREFVEASPTGIDGIVPVIVYIKNYKICISSIDRAIRKNAPKDANAYSRGDIYSIEGGFSIECDNPDIESKIKTIVKDIFIPVQYYKIKRTGEFLKV